MRVSRDNTVRTFAAIALLASAFLPSVARADLPADSAVLEFGRVDIVYRSGLDEQSAQLVHSSVPDVFSGRASERSLTQGLARLVRIVESEGYRQVRVSPTQFSASNGRLDFTLLITPGKRTVVNEVVFHTTAGADTAWLRQVVTLKTGVPLTRRWLEDAQDRIGSVSYLRISESPVFEARDRSSEDDVEDVRVVFTLVENAPSRFDGLVAANQQGDQAALTGRASLAFGGLFGRDRTVLVHFDRPRTQWRTLNIRYRDNGAAYAPVNWSVELDELTRNHRRQTLAGDLEYRVPQHHVWSIGSGGLWRRITPNGQLISPARVSEASLFLSKNATRRHLDRRVDLTFSVRAAYSHRRTLGVGPDNHSESRLRVGQNASMDVRLSRAWTLMVSSAGQWWIVGGDNVGPGDEWYLGGTEMLRGYEQQWFAAHSGVWGSLELERRLGSLSRLSTFIEAAEFALAADGGDDQHDTPYSYGWAISLTSLQRTGRLEVAWGRGAALRDGIIRLRMTQSW